MNVARTREGEPFQALRRWITPNRRSIARRRKGEKVELAEKISEIEPKEVLWNMAEAYIDGLLETGKEVIEREARQYIPDKLAELPFYRIR